MSVINDIFSNIKTPNQLLEFMSNNINYGYLGKNGRVYYFGDKDFDSSWKDMYVLESKNDILNTLVGNCWDQVELERDWFIEHGYNVRTIFEMVELDYDNNYPTHSFLVYEDENGNWNWFENSDYNNRGIHKFSSLEELINYQYDKYVTFLKEFNISDIELDKIAIREFSKPDSHISSDLYLDFVTNSKIVMSNYNKKNR